MAESLKGVWGAMHSIFRERRAQTNQLGTLTALPGSSTDRAVTYGAEVVSTRAPGKTPDWSWTDFWGEVAVKLLFPQLNSKKLRLFSYCFEIMSWRQRQYASSVLELWPAQLILGWDVCRSGPIPPCAPAHNATPGALPFSSSAIFFLDRRFQHLTPQHQFYGLQIQPNQSLHSPAVPLLPACLAAARPPP